MFAGCQYRRILCILCQHVLDNSMLCKLSTKENTLVQDSTHLTGDHLQVITRHTSPSASEHVPELLRLHYTTVCKTTFGLIYHFSTFLTLCCIPALAWIIFFTSSCTGSILPMKRESKKRLCLTSSTLTLDISECNVPTLSHTFDSKTYFMPPVHQYILLNLPTQCLIIIY